MQEHNSIMTCEAKSSHNKQLSHDDDECTTLTYELNEMLNDRVGWVGWILVEKANHSKYELKVHNMLKVAIHENR